ncbi:hypothetical protein LEP1GSC188_4426 [Leptospira weilii serovar Topaz str. LT2116]|uniref:Uncharacterized protein n=1 Tax=Leptospira weilii serovar Topaz str. LT2116 TaxID=1088540 RepID=M3GCY0_9LEPT|nr:hypothetical protein LEP1GSC188_4426 [Leptospira weilii serovar Topaz str. LT2116]
MDLFLEKRKDIRLNFHRRDIGSFRPPGSILSDGERIGKIEILTSPKNVHRFSEADFIEIVKNPWPQNFFPFK